MHNFHDLNHKFIVEGAKARRVCKCLGPGVSEEVRGRGEEVHSCDE